MDDGHGSLTTLKDKLKVGLHLCTAVVDVPRSHHHTTLQVVLLCRYGTATGQSKSKSNEYITEVLKY